MARREVEGFTEEPDMKTKEHLDVKDKHSVSFRCYVPDTILNINWLTPHSNTTGTISIST